ncbi:ornithine decarboxylase [Salmonella enterica subsp. enterica serovar Hadar str. ATCC 51956]|nr:ornithine decarboxylase [Salmonella enterica subsp. enterica serovar Hadar str. ATCC 51956]
MRGAGGDLGRRGAALFLALEEGINLLPGFSPELQGVYSETDADGIQRLYGYVLK